MPFDTTIDQRVSQSLSNATANGYKFEGWTALQIAEDLVAFDADFEGSKPADLVPSVRKWFYGTYDRDLA